IERVPDLPRSNEKDRRWLAGIHSVDDHGLARLKGPAWSRGSDWNLISGCCCIDADQSADHQVFLLLVRRRDADLLAGHQVGGDRDGMIQHLIERCGLSQGARKSE